MPGLDTAVLVGQAREGEVVDLLWLGGEEARGLEGEVDVHPAGGFAGEGVEDVAGDGLAGLSHC